MTTRRPVRKPTATSSASLRSFTAHSQRATTGLPLAELAHRSSAGRRTVSKRRPPDPVFRANPCCELTDLICRLPLTTFFYRPETFHLEDLMRLCVRPNVKIILSLRFSRTDRSAADTAKKCGALPAFQPYLETISFQGRLQF